MRRRLDGVLLLDKPAGPSSSAVLQSVKRALGAKKAGHAGTLDPLASGLLPLLFGEATKFAQFGLDAPKEYRARIQLGVTTDTGDAEGEILDKKPVAVADAALHTTLVRFRGLIEQVPPMYSALKRDGRPLYALAREGRTVERAPRKVEIFELELRGREKDALEVQVRCSKGTYIRQLAVDLGEALGTGAHLAGLRRTAVGRMRLEDAVPFDAVEKRGAELLRPVDCLLEDLPRIDLEAREASRFLSGAAVAALDARPEGVCRVYAQGGLLGVGRLAGASLQPLRSIARG